MYMQEPATLSKSGLLSALMKRLLPRAKAAITKLKKMQRETGTYRFRGTTEYPAHQFYDTDVFRRCMAVIHTFDRLSDVRRFMRRIPRAEELRSDNVSQERWVDYHYAYHVVLVSSVYDLSLLLTNSVLRLGLPERLATADSVKNNFWSKQQEITPFLAAIEKATGSHRSSRNLYLHRGESMDVGDVIGSEEYDMLTFIAFADAAGSSQLSEPGFLDAAFRVQVDTLLPKLEGECAELSKLVFALFEKLEPIYRSTSSALHSAARRRTRKKPGA